MGNDSFDPNTFAELSLEEQAMLAKEDEKAFEQLLKNFEKRNKVTAYKVAGHYITESDDEWSVTLLAFYEAVQQYEPGKGSFASFSDMVIKRRLIDNLRKDIRHSSETSVDVDGEEGYIVDGAVSEAAETDRSEQENLKLEIEALSAELAKYDVTFADLTQVSPRAGKTRKACALAINTIADDQELLAQMRDKRTLPAKGVMNISKVPQKILERHRKYIIAATEIIAGDYPYLYEYVRAIRTEGRN